MHRPKQSRHGNNRGPRSEALCQDLQRKSAEDQLFRRSGEEEKSECSEDGRTRELAAGPLETDVAEDQAACEERGHHESCKGQAGAKLNGPVREKTDAEGA